MSNIGTLSVNMAQMDRFQVCADTVVCYENIIANGGKFFTLDARRYVDLLCEFNIFYTFAGGA